MWPFSFRRTFPRRPLIPQKVVEICQEGRDYPLLLRLADPQRAARRGFPRSFLAPDVSGFSFLALDVTRTSDGRHVVIEANGSNAAFSSTPFGHDLLRAEHMADCLLARLPAPRQRAEGVALLAHTMRDGFRFGPEFYCRAGLFAQELERRGQPAKLRAAWESLDADGLDVAVGAIPELAESIARRGSTLLYRDRPVVFAQNPNLLPELARRGIVTSAGDGTYDVDTSIFHDGPLVPVVHDKAWQQRLCAETGLSELRHAEAANLEEALDVVAQFHGDGLACVGKMNAGSGGAGIELFPAPMVRDAVDHRLRRLLTGAEKKYGPGTADTAFPLRFFEFARSTDFPADDGGHVWDLRLICLLDPGRVQVYPAVMRIAPKPFDENCCAADRDRWVSNMTGREPSLARLRSGLDDAALASVGLGPAALDRLLESSARWCVAAWRQATSGTSDVPYERVCELSETLFYEFC